MGAWGAGSFENDDALDFAGEITTLASIEAPLDFVWQGEPIEADHACRIIAAAECVAALQGHPPSGFPEELAARLATLGTPEPSLIGKVRDRLSIVLSGSELGQLWAEEGSGDWNRAMTDLMERLNAPVRARNLKRNKARKPKPMYNRSRCSFCGEEMGQDAFTQFDVTVEETEISVMRKGGWAHLKCLNAALHPCHMVQHWEVNHE